jgi:serine/threonine-protein kinase HipA
MNQVLLVYWDAQPVPVGALVRKPGGDTVFRYSDAGRQISHSLPFDGGAREHPITFFENLLPDGVQRERLAARLGVSDTSTFTLLEHVGGDCAGALSLYREGVVPDRAPTALRPLDDALLVRFVDVGVVPTLVNEGVRLSLAGAQNKVPVVLRDEQLFLPEGHSASTHILKFANDDYRGLVENEHFMLELARAVGLDVARSRLWKLPYEFGQALLVERYDRVDGRRLHQEDFCQATGNPPSKKYEADDGPSLIDVFRVLDIASTDPAKDLISLVKWHAFNVATGNNDGHAKNISLLREPTVRLAPVYDLVCTRAWPALSKHLAFRVGGAVDAGATGPNAWRKFASEAQMSPKLVLDAAATVSASVAEHAPMLAQRLIDEGADARALHRACEVVQEHARRALRLIEIEGKPVAKKKVPQP